MRILFDKNVPVGARSFLAGHVALVVLGSNIWPVVRKHSAAITTSIDDAAPGSYAFIEMPLPPKPRRTAPL